MTEISGVVPSLEAVVVVGAPDVEIDAFAYHDYEKLLAGARATVEPVDVAPVGSRVPHLHRRHHRPVEGLHAQPQLRRVHGRARSRARGSAPPTTSCGRRCRSSTSTRSRSRSSARCRSAARPASRVASRSRASGRRSSAAGATIASMLGSLAILVANADDHPEQAGHRLRLCAAAPMPPDIDRIWRERFGCTTFSGGFGLTEASLIAALPPGEENRPGAAGRSTRPSSRSRCSTTTTPRSRPVRPARSAAGRASPTRCSRATGTAPPTASRCSATCGSTPATSARVDDDGFLYFVDRKKDSLRRRGENISSFEMEKTFFAHPAIKDVAVHAAPSEMGEDEVKVTARAAARRRARRRGALPLGRRAGAVLRDPALHRVPRRPAPQPGRAGAEVRAARARV